MLDAARLAPLALLAALGPPPQALAQQGPPPVTVASPVVKEIVEDDEFVGRFEAAERVDIRARVSGYLQEVHFTDGALVSEGDLLYTIDQRIFRNALTQAEAQIDIAQASFDFTLEQLERAEQLILNGNIPQSTVDERREAHLSAQGGLEQARAQLEDARINLEFSEIRAPISGRIDRTRVTPGNLVQQDATVLTSLVSTDPMHFYFDIDERYFIAYSTDARVMGVDLQQGAGDRPVRVTLSDPRIPPRDGVLDFSENQLDPDAGAMRVRAVVPNDDGALVPGLFGVVNVPGSLPYEGVLIPDEAIVADQNRRLVLLVDDAGAVSRREIRPGPRIDGYRVVRDGLDGSETLIVEGILRARGGQVSPERIELPPVAED
ncbi:MAG: efflux RND transporter periplasmic adaptor subunit [Pseudomonadota bacterium]